MICTTWSKRVTTRTTDWTATCMIAPSIPSSHTIQSNTNFFGPDALVENCPLIDSVFVGSNAHLLNSTLQCCTVLSSASHPSK